MFEVLCLQGWSSNKARLNFAARLSVVYFALRPLPGIKNALSTETLTGFTRSSLAI